MQRRAFMGGLAAAGVGALEGCTAPVGRRRLSDPAERREADEVVLRFGEAGDPVARSTIDYTDTPVTGEILPFRYLMWHREGTNVESLRLSIRAPPVAHQVPAAVYLAVPRNGEIPDLELFADRDTGTPTIEIADLGIMGEGTFGMKFYLEPSVPDTPLTARIDVSSRVTESGFLGREYQLEGTTRIDMARPKSEQ